MANVNDFANSWQTEDDEDDKWVPCIPLRRCWNSLQSNNPYLKWSPCVKWNIYSIGLCPRVCRRDVILLFLFLCLYCVVVPQVKIQIQTVTLNLRLRCPNQKNVARLKTRLAPSGKEAVCGLGVSCFNSHFNPATSSSVVPSSKCQQSPSLHSLPHIKIRGKNVKPTKTFSVTLFLFCFVFCLTDGPWLSLLLDIFTWRWRHRDFVALNSDGFSCI